MGFGLVAVVGIAALAALWATGKIGGGQLSGEITILESQRARFDREVHGSLAGPTLRPGDRDTSLCLKLAAAQGIQPGGPVVLYDEMGSVIAEGALGRAPSEATSRQESEDIPVCAFRFLVDDIRKTETVTLEIGGARRATYQRDELDAHDWFVQVPLGA
jgi:hypothetical protein